MSQDTFTKITKMLEELPKEEFQQQVFPSIAFSSSFIELVKWHEDEIASVKSLKLGETKFEIVRDLLNKLQIERGFDLIFEQLHKDQYTITKKLDSHHISEDFVKKMDSGESIYSEDLCDEYEKLFERVCKRFLKPFTRIITHKNIKKCGVCIESIKNFESKMNLVLEPFIPHIRNSINHSDYYYDKHKQVIVFDDEDIRIEKNEQQMRELIRSMIESELVISAAHSSFQLPLWKAIIIDTNEVIKYCKILGIDFDKLMKKYLPKGYSIFNIKFVLENVIKRKKLF